MDTEGRTLVRMEVENLSLGPGETTDVRTLRPCYGLILQEVDGSRCVRIVIGANEARAIECVLRNFVPPRPLTHDLLYNILQQYGVKVESVVIDMLPDGIFSGNILLSSGIDTGCEKHTCIDARSSDAIAIAVRANAPIYMPASLLEKLSPSSVQQHAESRSEPDIEELKRRQRAAIDIENYEEAARLKQEIDRLSSPGETQNTEL